MPGTVKKLEFSEGTDVGAPTDLSLQTSTAEMAAYPDDATFITAEGAPGDGSCYFNTTIRKFRFYLNSAWRNNLSENDPTDPTKVFKVDLTAATTGKTATLYFPITDDRQYSFPDAASTIANLESAQTFSGQKTLNTPLVSGGSIDVATAGALAIFASVGANFLDIGGSTTNVRIPGNLEVLGTVTKVNSTDLEVKDKNITINKGGTDLSSEGAGITVDRTGTKGSQIYGAAYASKFASGDLGDEREMVTVDHEQTIENKRMRLDTTPAADDTTSPRDVPPSNTLANLQAISAGNQIAGARYYATDVKRNYFWDGSTLRPVGSGSGSGSGDVNFIGLADLSSDFEADLSGWNTYKDAAASTPVDGTGGSPTVVSISRNTTTPLNGTADLKFSKSASNGQGEGMSIDIPVPKGYQFGQQIGVSFLMDNTAASAYATGDLAIFVYDIDNAVFKTVDVSQIPKNLLTKFTVYFDGSNTANYRLIFHVATTNASAYDIYFDDFTFGPIKKAVTTAKISRWRERTDILFSSGTVIQSYWFKERQVGEEIEADFEVKIGSGSSGGGSFHIEIPGYDVDPNEFALGGTLKAVGHSTYYQSPSVYFGQMQWKGTTGAQFVMASTYNIADSVGSRLRTMGEADMNNNDLIGGQIKFKPTQLIGQGVLYESEVDVEYASNSDSSDADDSSAYAHGPNGSAGILGTTALTTYRYKDVEWLRPRQADDIEILEISPNGTDWFPMIGYVYKTANDFAIPAFVARDPSPAGNFSFGVGFEHIDATHTRVWFGKAPYLANGYTTGWNGYTGFKWRVMRAKKGVALGFQYVSQTASGLVKSAGQLLGTNTNDDAASGYVGEVIEDINLGGTVSIDGSGRGVLGSVTLTPGHWEISQIIVLNAAGGLPWPNTGGAFGGISLTNTGDASFTTDVGYFEDYQSGASINAGNNYVIRTTPETVKVSSNTTYYSKIRWNAAASSNRDIFLKLRAVRIR